MRRTAAFIIFSMLLTLWAGIVIDSEKQDLKDLKITVNDIKVLNNMPFEKVVKLPESESYNPQISIIPLCEPSFRYGKDIPKASFADETGKLIKLPSSARYYADVRYDRIGANGSYEAPVSGVVLYNSEKKCAYMNMGGNVVTDFKYTLLFDGEYPSTPAHGRYISVCVETGKKDKVRKFGLIDIENGKELLLPEYDFLEVYSAYALVSKDAKYSILDFSGNVLFDFGETKPFAGVYTMTGNDVVSPYVIDTENHAVYKNTTDDPVSLFFYRNGYMVLKDKFYDKLLLDKDLNILYQTSDSFYESEITDSYAMFYTPSRLIYYEPVTRLEIVPIAEFLSDFNVESILKSQGAQGDFVSLILRAKDDESLRYQIFLGLDGNVDSETDLGAAEKLSANVLREGDLYFITDANGGKKVKLIGIALESKHFVVDYYKNNPELERSLTLHGKDGAEILKGYEYIVNSYNEDFTVVYTDIYNCVIIKPDGTQIKLKNPNAIYPIKHYSENNSSPSPSYDYYNHNWTDDYDDDSESDISQPESGEPSQTDSEASSQPGGESVTSQPVTTNNSESSSESSTGSLSSENESSTEVSTSDGEAE